MLLVLAHSIEQDLDLFVLDVYLPGVLVELLLQVGDGLFFLLHLGLLAFLFLFDLGDFLLDKLNDLVLVFHLLFGLNQLLLGFCQLLPECIHLKVEGLQLLV